MDPIKAIQRNNLEYRIEKEIIEVLEHNGWLVEKIHGNIHQQGLPDLIACHRDYGVRFIEVKRPNMTGSSFTPAQLRKFPAFAQNGMPIYILCDSTPNEIAKLRQPPNVMAVIGPYLISAAASTSEEKNNAIRSGEIRGKMVVPPDLRRCCNRLPQYIQRGGNFYLKCPTCGIETKRGCDNPVVVQTFWDVNDVGHLIATDSK